MWPELSDAEVDGVIGAVRAVLTVEDLRRDLAFLLYRPDCRGSPAMDHSDTPLLSALILTHNDENYIEACLKELPQHRLSQF